MDTILGFFSDLILFTAGLAVITLWIFLIVLAVDEGIDLVMEHRNKDHEEVDA